MTRRVEEKLDLIRRTKAGMHFERLDLNLQSYLASLKYEQYLSV